MNNLAVSHAKLLVLITGKQISKRFEGFLTLIFRNFHQTSIDLQNKNKSMVDVKIITNHADFKGTVMQSVLNLQSLF